MRATKLTSLLILIYLLPFSSFPQQRNNQLSIKLTADKITLNFLSREVFRQLHYVFSYNSKNIDPNAVILISKENLSLNNLLSLVSQQLDVRYKIQDNYIILYKNHSHNITAKQELQNQSLNISKTELKKNDIDFARNDSLRKILNDDTLIIFSPDRNRMKYINQSIDLISFDSKDIDNKLPSLIISSTPLIAKEKNSSLKKSTVKTNRENLFDKNYGLKNIFTPYISASIESDETMYLNANVNAGFRWLFGTIDWSTNFKKSMFLYGAGTSFSLGKNWSVQLSGLTGGRASNNYRLNSLDNRNDSTTSLLAKAFLSRINLLMKKQISSHIQLAFGPIFNFMNTKYYINNSLISIKSDFPDSQKPYETYYVLKPPYTLSDNVNSNTTVNKKTWIGFKIGLLYIIQ